jgi:Holliday junction resolvase RusA-like endonuclease
VATTFEVPGEPVAKGRPRFARVGQHIRTFTPEKSVRYEDTVRLFAQAAGVPILSGPVRVTIDAVWSMKGTPLKKGLRPSVPKATKPDADNVAKALCDALNGIAWHDDGQVVELVVRKRHAAQGEAARTVVTIAEAA